jgi:hypothetical protein
MSGAPRSQAWLWLWSWVEFAGVCASVRIRLKWWAQRAVQCWTVAGAGGEGSASGRTVATERNLTDAWAGACATSGPRVRE